MCGGTWPPFHGETKTRPDNRFPLDGTDNLIDAPAPNPQSLDRYTYALNDPVSNIDPLGLSCIHTDDGTTADNGDGKGCSEMNNNPQEVNVSGDGPGSVDTSSLAHLGSLGYGWSASNGTGVDVGSTPQTRAPQRPQKKPCTPLPHDPSLKGVDTTVAALSRITHPLDLAAVNGTMFVAAGGQIFGGYMLIALGCSTPAGWLTCAPSAAMGTLSITSGFATAAFGAYYFKTQTLPAIKDWGCHE